MRYLARYPKVKQLGNLLGVLVFFRVLIMVVLLLIHLFSPYAVSRWFFLSTKQAIDKIHRSEPVVAIPDLHAHQRLASGYTPYPQIHSRISKLLECLQSNQIWRSLAPQYQRLSSKVHLSYSKWHSNSPPFTTEDLGVTISILVA